MWKFLIICVVMSALNNEGDAASSRTPVRRRRGYAGSYAGSSASSDGGVGGYVGGYNDYDDYNSGYAPHFGITDPYLFHQQLTNHILAQNYANQQAITGLAASGNAFVSADASISNDDTRIQQQIAAQQAFHDNLAYQNRYRGGSSGGSSGGYSGGYSGASSGGYSGASSGSGSGGSYNSHRYAPSYALASGSIGSNGHRQTAYISPANPASPNIVNRFGSSSSSSSSGGGGGGGGYKGVSVSSFSSSNGDGTSRRGAQTTINDNGKVTSYSVHS